LADANADTGQALNNKALRKVAKFRSGSSGLETVTKEFTDSSQDFSLGAAQKSGA
jgi:hypothetical protein